MMPKTASHRTTPILVNNAKIAYQGNMIPVLFSLVMLGSLFMAYRRYQSNNRGFAYAWLGCAAVNAFCLLQYLFAPLA